MSSIKKVNFQANYSYLNGYAYFLLSTFLIIFVLSVDRADLLDHDNYIEYFSSQYTLYDFFQKISTESLIHAIALFFSEEPLWLLYTQILSKILSPILAVYFTVFLLNYVIIYSCSKFEYRISGLLLWIVLPMGAAVMGLFQIRQGLAFSVLALFFAHRWNLTVGCLIAAMVHTTFAVPGITFLFVSLKIFRSRPLLFILVFAIVCFFLASFFAINFQEFGGRRVGYDINEGPNKFNAIIGNFLLALPSIILVFDRKIQVTKNVMEISLMQIGIFIWNTACWVVFPLGMSRIYYFAAIFSIFPILISGFDLYRKHPLPMSAYVMAVILIINGGVRDGAYVNNTYTSKQLLSSDQQR